MTAYISAIGNSTRLDRILNRDLVSHLIRGYVEVGEEKFCLANAYKDNEYRIRNFQVRDDDVYLAAFPKTGTTWSCEMIWLIVNNLNYDGAKEIIQKRCPLLEFSAIIDSSQEDMYGKGSMEYIAGLESPRCIKTHLAYPLLPEQIRNGSKKPKLITVIRNPQDVCISKYHFMKGMETYSGTFDDFCDLFLGGRVPFAPFWEHILSYWHQRHHLDILFIKYKDMKDDLSSVIKEVAKFLDKTISDVDVENLEKHLSFDNMKNNPAVNYKNVVSRYTSKGDSAASEKVLMRSGKEGAYKTVMSPELIRRFEEWTKEKISETGIKL